jgi:signal transduction histidine kinase
MNNLREISPFINTELGLIIFRIVEEYFHNGVIYGHAQYGDINMQCIEDQLHLTLGYKGKRFDVKAAQRRKTSHGLFSMLELVRSDLKARIEWGDQSNDWIQVTLKICSDPQNLDSREQAYHSPGKGKTEWASDGSSMGNSRQTWCWLC